MLKIPYPQAKNYARSKISEIPHPGKWFVVKCLQKFKYPYPQAKPIDQIPALCPASPCRLDIDRCILHLSIEIRKPPPRAKVGEWGVFLWYLKARFARGGGGFLRICFTHCV